MRGQTMAQRFAPVVAGVALLAGCSAPSGPSNSLLSPSPTVAGPAVVVDGPVAVTAERDLLVRCYGEGAPTILLEAGDSDLTTWPHTFVQVLAETTTNCAYSRAGGYGSTPLEGPLTRDVIVHDAFTLMDNLQHQYGVSGPYLLVGWSFGGSVILAEALAHPERTAGLVVLDNNFTVDYLKVCRASGRAERECQRLYEEDEEAKSIEKDIADRVRALPDLPIAEVSAMRNLDDCWPAPDGQSVSYEAAGVILTAPDCEALAERVAEQNLRNWRQLGPQVKEFRVQASHDGLINEAGPEIIKIIKKVLGAR